MESKQRTHARGTKVDRHSHGRIGEHLHSDLAIVNVKDYSGYIYVLTVVDEISDEVVAVLLKEKTAETVLSACKRAHAIITSRANSKLKTWQFDRGSDRNSLTNILMNGSMSNSALNNYSPTSSTPGKMAVLNVPSKLFS